MTKADPQSLSRDDLALTAAFLIALAATLGALFELLPILWTVSGMI